MHTRLVRPPGAAHGSIEEERRKEWVGDKSVQCRKILGFGSDSLHSNAVNKKCH